MWEVDEIIPTMEFYVQELLSIKKRMKSLTGVLERCSTDFLEIKSKETSDPIHVSLQYKLKHECNEYISVIEKIAEMGVVVDDLEFMAFDFYSWLDGSEIFLCWQSGERQVNHWHLPEESFSERRLLDLTDILNIDSTETFLN